METKWGIMINQKYETQIDVAGGELYQQLFQTRYKQIAYPFEHELVFGSEEEEIMLDGLKTLINRGIDVERATFWDDNEIQVSALVQIYNLEELAATLVVELEQQKRKLHLAYRDLSNPLLTAQPLNIKTAATKLVVQEGALEKSYLALIEDLAQTQYNG